MDTFSLCFSNNSLWILQQKLPEAFSFFFQKGKKALKEILIFQAILTGFFPLIFLNRSFISNSLVIQQNIPLNVCLHNQTFSLNFLQTLPVHLFPTQVNTTSNMFDNTYNSLPIFDGVVKHVDEVFTLSNLSWKQVHSKILKEHEQVW